MKSEFAKGVGPEVEAAIAHREAEVLGKPIRIEPLEEDEISQESRELMADLRSAFGTRPSPDEPIAPTFRMSLKHPGLFKHQFSFISFLLTEGLLSKRDRELAVIRLLWLCGSPNPYGEHVALAENCGISDDEVARLLQGSEVEGWSEHDKAILAAVEQLYDRQWIEDAVWDVLAKTWSDAQLFEFVIVVGQYFGSAIFHNAVRTRMSEYNRGLRHHEPAE